MGSHMRPAHSCSEAWSAGAYAHRSTVPETLLIKRGYLAYHIFDDLEHFAHAHNAVVLPTGNLPRTKGTNDLDLVHFE
jgi:hypothetical protein